MWTTCNDFSLVYYFAQSSSVDDSAEQQRRNRLTCPILAALFMASKVKKRTRKSIAPMQRSLAGVEDRQRLLGQERQDGSRPREHGRRRRRGPRQRRGHRRLEGGLDVLQEEAGIRGKLELPVVVPLVISQRYCVERK